MTIYSKLEAPNWRVLDVARGWGGDGTSNYGHLNVWPKNNPTSSNQRFQFRDTGDGSFQIAVNDGGKCIGHDDHWQDWLSEQDCANVDSQKWYLEPSPSGGFMIRSVQDDQCLNASGGYSGQNFVFHSNHVGTYTCYSGDTASFFSIEDPAAGDQRETPAMYSLATSYAMTKCDKDQSYCKWEITSRSDPTYGTPICRGHTEKNETGSDVPKELTKTETSIESTTLGSAIQDSSEVGVTLTLGAKDTFAVQVGEKFTHSWQSNYARTTGTQKTWTDKTTITIPPGQYGWLEEQPRVQDVTGHLTFDQNGWAQWTYGADSSNPAVAKIALGGGDNGNGLWISKTGDTLPDYC
ncbi:RICIN domain-containing protein [Streptomyces sp. NPDC048506]|uniref:RICIN domain-containing protein n=1 Tax=Streptomyces sp. NPDC048506 TaxID=3155028 RepID=UPI003416F59E